MLRLVLLGAPGAGKGTLAKALTQSLGLPHVSTGDLFRQNIAQGTELGHLAESYIQKGLLVPDEVTNGMLASRIEAADCQNGFILDGYPRVIDQAVYLDQYLRAKGAQLDSVLNIDVPMELIVDRLSTRLTCTGCGHIYNSRTCPPHQEGLCDVCGSPVYVRDDDREETVKARLETYRQLTEPLIAYYQQEGLLHRVDNTKRPEESLALVLEFLSQLSSH